MGCRPDVPSGRSGPNLHAARTADDDLLGHAEEEAGTDDARAGEEAPVQLLRVADPVEPAVQDVVPLVGHEGLSIGVDPQFRFPPQRLHEGDVGPPAERDHLDRQGVRFALIENEARTRQAVRGIKDMFRKDGLL